MTNSTTTTPYETLRLRHVARLGERMPPMLERLTWPAEKLAEHRTAELRRLLRVARDASPWHRERLIGVDIDAIDEAGIAALPVMTKDDLMGHFDDIVTDDRLTLSVVEDHLARLTSDAYLFDRYHAAATGGSSGRRAVLVYDWDTWADLFCTVQRHQARAMALAPELAAAPPRMAMVASAAPAHTTRTLPQTFSNPRLEMHRFPVTTPLEEIVAGLNACQPALLIGYPSALHSLAAEARAGRLRIAPLSIGSTSEPLLPETRAAVEEAFGVRMLNHYGISEGGAVGHSCHTGSIHLSDDLLIIEPVDVDGRPVPPGTRCAKLYLTNLFNHTQPLIRYEVTDQIELIDDDTPCVCGCTHRRITDPYGRLDDVFTYGAVTVHPHVFRSPLSRRREIVEYQVRQTAAGAAVSVRVIDPCDTDALGVEITAELGRLGIADAQVDVEVVDGLPRPPSGKLVRFVPLR